MLTRRKPLPGPAPTREPSGMALDPEARREELTRAPKSDPEDAAPRITTRPGRDGATRIDVADTAVVRPGKPHVELDD
jgi:hypothetical protein